MDKIIELKRNIRNEGFKIAKQHGYSHAIRSIEKLIDNSTKKCKEQGKPEMAIQIRGECCEILLELYLYEYATKYNLPWIVSKGLCLTRTDGGKNKTTELDIVLFTPAKIVIFESKYRKGKIRLLENCTLIDSRNQACDVYKQNLMHLNNLKSYFSSALIKVQASKPFRLILYVESVKRVNDLRTPECKRKMSVVGKENLIQQLDSLRLTQSKSWDMKKVLEIATKLDKTSKKNINLHMKEVRK